MGAVVKTNKAVYRGPAHWGEMTMRQYVKLGKDWWDRTDLTQGIASVVGIEYNVFSAMSDVVLNQLLVVFAYLGVDPKYRELKVPDSIVIEPGARVIVLPKKITSLSIGQNMMVRRKLEEVELIDQAVAYALAVFIEPLISGKPFNSDNVDQIEQLLLDMPANAVYPAGFFVCGHVVKRGTTLLQRIARTLHSFPRPTNRQPNLQK